MANRAADEFAEECRARAATYPGSELDQAARAFVLASTAPKYSYNFTWLGRPIIQYPQDILAMQELIWNVKPDLIIETGIAHGGSLIFSASMLAILDNCDSLESAEACVATRRRVIGIDIDIRSHNMEAIKSHPMSHRIHMIEGSSIMSDTVAQVHVLAKGYKRILVCLDSNHTHEHVLAELEAYAPLVSLGSYCVVFDTVIENLPDGLYPDRPWARGNNPMTAIREFLATLADRPHLAADGKQLRFEIDSEMDRKLLISVAPQGYLRRIADGG